MTELDGLNFDIDKTVTLQLAGVINRQTMALAKPAERIHFED